MPLSFKIYILKLFTSNIYIYITLFTAFCCCVLTRYRFSWHLEASLGFWKCGSFQSSSTAIGIGSQCQRPKHHCEVQERMEPLVLLGQVESRGSSFASSTVSSAAEEARRKFAKPVQPKEPIPDQMLIKIAEHYNTATASLGTIRYLFVILVGYSC